MRTRQLLISFLALMCSTYLHAQVFDDYFTDNTLRIDYIFAGDRNQQNIYVDQLSKTKGWFGRRKRLNQLPLEGNGQITVTDSLTGKVIYRHSFSTLFQEWISTEESKNTPKSFENVFLVPFPQRTAIVRVDLFDYHQNVSSSLTHVVDPSDILVRYSPAS